MVGSRDGPGRPRPVPPVFPPYVTVLLTQSLIYAIAAMSLDILIGYTGLAALGHAAFFAIGAYTAAILFERYQSGFGTTLVCSIGLAAAASAALGPLSLRATQLYFLMITLSIAMCMWGLIYQWASLTGGDNGISGDFPPRSGPALVHAERRLLLLFHFDRFRRLCPFDDPPDSIPVRQDPHRYP